MSTKQVNYVHKIQCQRHRHNFNNAIKSLIKPCTEEHLALLCCIIFGGPGGPGGRGERGERGGPGGRGGRGGRGGTGGTGGPGGPPGGPPWGHKVFIRAHRESGSSRSTLN
ncbi:hypothetical protein FHG87_023598 [Trinorchestia longiramus]|nr:hypothetical protein FHG87_023598 [Trinorchestia longiramus]